MQYHRQTDASQQCTYYDSHRAKCETRDRRQRIRDRGITEYYLLLSEKLFDENCRICDYSVYHGNKIHPRGELKDYIIQESKERGNLYCTYKGTEESEIVFDTGEIKVVPYDIYHIV